jgi:hypothetical protein
MMLGQMPRETRTRVKVKLFDVNLWSLAHA